jgi:hypothetical protein
MADYFILNSYMASEISRPHGPDISKQAQFV